MASNSHSTYVYVGLGGEYPLIMGAPPVDLPPGGLYRRKDGEEEWIDISVGLPDGPQVRALMVHPENTETIFAVTQHGV